MCYVMLPLLTGNACRVQGPQPQFKHHKGPERCPASPGYGYLLQAFLAVEGGRGDLHGGL